MSGLDEPEDRSWMPYFVPWLQELASLADEVQRLHQRVIDDEEFRRSLTAEEVAEIRERARAWAAFRPGPEWLNMPRDKP